MALTPLVQASQGVVRATAGAVAPEVKATQTAVRAVIQFPAEEVRVSQTATRLVGPADNVVKASQAVVRVVIAGRIDNPRVLAWPMHLDGHSFYVLQLGEQSTIAFDMATREWMELESPTRNTLRAVAGLNWTGIGGNILSSVGASSNMIAGDDVFGVLWLFDPELPYDQSPLDGTELAFDRVVMGGVPIRMRDTVRCNEAYVTSAKGRESLTEADPVINLATSDDGGVTYVDQGDITVVDGQYDQAFAWRSLGHVRSPGRLFKITDNCVARIDALDIR